MHLQRGMTTINYGKTNYKLNAKQRKARDKALAEQRKLLKKVGIYSMYLADPDIVEDKNLLYQNFSKATVGQKKVDSLSGISVGHIRSPYNILTDAQIKGSKSVPTRISR